MENRKKNALISAYNKEGVLEFASELTKLDWKIYASSGTAKVLTANGIPATDIATIVGEPILGHRVVTLSREIHAALLATESEEDIEELERLKIPWIDLVYVNFYPLREETEKPGATIKDVIEKTDIGGPTLLRSAAKGRRLVISEPAEMLLMLQMLKFGDPDNHHFRDMLAMRAESAVAEYCSTSARFLKKNVDWKSQGIPKIQSNSVPNT